VQVDVANIAATRCGVGQTNLSVKVRTCMERAGVMSSMSSLSQHTIEIDLTTIVMDDLAGLMSESFNVYSQYKIWRTYLRDTVLEYAKSGRISDLAIVENSVYKIL
jgi:hypothetical protein